MADPRSQVTFYSDAFNTSVAKEEFINEGNFGDDLAHWMAKRLNGLGWETDEIAQEDHGWTFTFSRGDSKCDLVVGMFDEDPGHWLAWIEPCTGLLASIFGARNRRGIPEDAAQAVHQALASAPEVRSINWFLKGETMFDEPGDATPTDH